MIFRTREARSATGGAHVDVLLTQAESAFGRYPDAIDGSTVTFAGRRFAFEPERSPSFVMEPSCDRCGVRPPEQFPLAVDHVAGAEVWVQTHATCRDCRFVLLASASAERLPCADTGLDLQAHERRLERRARRRARRDARSAI